MQRTLKVMALGIVTALSVGSAIAQTGTLQGRQLFLYDNGTGPNLNRISVQTPADATLVSNWALTLPGTAGVANQLLVNTGGGVMNWTSTLTLQDLTLTGDLGVGGNTTLGDAPTDIVTVNGTMSFPGLTAGQPLQTNALGEVVSELINLTGAADVTGTLPVTNGGTGLSTVVTGDILFGSAANTLSARAIGGAGDLLTVTGGVPVWESRASVIGSTVWTLGGNTSGITGVNNILGINMVSAAPLRLYANGNEIMRLTATGDVRIQNLDGVGATQLNIVGTATQAGANLLNIQNSALNFAFRVDEQPGTLARIQVGDGTLDGQIRLFNGVPGGVANIAIQNNLAATRAYTIPTIEAAGRFVVANGSGTVDQILLSNGNNNRSVWSSAIPTTVTMSFTSITNGTSTGTLLIGAGGSLAPSGGGTITANAYDGILPVANGGTGLSTITLNGVMYGNGTSAVQTTVGTDGQILTAGVAGLPTWSNTLPAATVVPFDRLEDGNNNQALMVVSGTATLTPSGTGVIEANAITGLAGNGMVARTAAGTFAARTIVGTSPIAVANGDGVAGNPTISISGAIPVANGGTGLTTATSGSMLYASAADVYSSLAAGTAGQVLTMSGGFPAWSSSIPSGTTISFADVTAGTNLGDALVIGAGSSLSATGGGTITANQFASATSASNLVDLGAASAEVAGVLPIANGGTGLSTAPLSNQILVGNGAGYTLTDLSTISWIPGGNTGITGVNNILGITDANVNPLRVYTNNTQRFAVGAADYSITFNNPNVLGSVASIASARELRLQQSGDVFGFSRLSLQHRNGSNGALFETDPAGPALVDFGFKPGAGVQSNIRLEARAASLRNAANAPNGEFQFFMNTTGAPIYTLSVGSSTAVFENVSVGVGDATPDSRFTVGNSSEFRVSATGDLVRIKNVPYVWPAANATGVLTNDASGNLSWVPVSATSLSGVVPVANGGTGLSAAPINSILYASAANTYSSLTPGNNQILISGPAGVPVWSSSLPAATTVPFNQIATGANSTAAMTVDNGASIVLGTAGAIIEANRFIGSGSTSNAVDLATAEVNGILPIANGGTGSSTASGALSNLGGQPLDAELTSISGLAGTGFLTQIAAGTYAQRTIVGTSPISVTNGDGVAGNPTIALTGTVGVANGGTGLTTAATGSVLYASAPDVYSSLAPGAAGTVLTIVAGLPVWQAPSAGSFGSITSGTNNSATMTVDNGASIVLGTAGAIIEANRFIGSGSTSNAVDLATAEVNGILPIANGGTGSSTASGALSNLGGQPLDAELTSISGLAGTGFLTQIAAGTYAQRTIIGTSPISVADGDGVAGNPTISISGAIPVANGGTGLTTAPINSILYASAANTYSSLTPGNNQILISGPAGVPVWSSSLPTATTVPFNQIATGANSTATMTVDNGASIVLGTAGAIIEANRFIGSGSTSNAIDLATTEVNGILPVANGGTGLSSVTSGAITYGNGTSALNVLANPGTVSILTHNGTVPSWFNVVATEVQAQSNLATTGFVVRTGPAAYTTRLVAGTANEITVTNGDGVLGNAVVSIPTAVTFTGKTITGGTYDGITTTSTTTVQGPVVLSPATQSVTPATGAGTDIAAFTRSFEKVTVDAGGAAATFVNLTAGTDGQVAYVRFTCNNTGATPVTLRQPDDATATTISWAAGANTTIVAHMIYSSSDSKWVILSAVANP